MERFKLYYLAAWGKYATSEELWRLSSLSDQLACVYRALSWYLYINPARKHDSDTHQRPAQWLRIIDARVESWDLGQLGFANVTPATHEGPRHQRP